MSYVTFNMVRTVVAVRDELHAAREELRAKGSRKEKQVQRSFGRGKGQDGYNVTSEGCSSPK